MAAQQTGDTALLALLDSLQLGDFKAKFVGERIDLAAARLLKEEDLAALGLPMGPRKKLLHALSESHRSVVRVPKRLVSPSS